MTTPNDFGILQGTQYEIKFVSYVFGWGGGTEEYAMC